MQSESKRNGTIDALRGFAILTVAGVHGLIPDWITKLIPGSFGRAFWGNGAYGVSMFFTISGYLITSHVLRRSGSLRDLDLIDFYARRVGRIIPPLALLVSLCSLLFVLKIHNFYPNDPAMFYKAIWNIITLRYNSFYFVGNVEGLRSFSPLWSLTIEEQFSPYYV